MKFVYIACCTDNIVKDHRFALLLLRNLTTDSCQVLYKQLSSLSNQNKCLLANKSIILLVELAYLPDSVHWQLHKLSYILSQYFNELTSHLIEFFPLHPSILVFFFIDHLLHAVFVYLLLFLCLIDVPLLDLWVQCIPALWCLTEEHSLLKVINLGHLLFQLCLILLHVYRECRLRFLDDFWRMRLLLEQLLLLFSFLGLLDKVIVSIDLIEVNNFRHCHNL